MKEFDGRKFLDLDTRKVMVMNKKTWDSIVEIETTKAIESDNPIGYLGRLTGIDVELDETLPDNHVEVYERWMLEAVRKYGRMK